MSFSLIFSSIDIYITISNFDLFALNKPLNRLKHKNSHISKLWFCSYCFFEKLSSNLSRNNGYSIVFFNYRPGRLDVKVEFKQSRREDVAAILKNFYGDLLDDQEILLKDLPDQVFTPAEVTQILLGNMDSPGHAIKELCQGLHVTA